MPASVKIDHALQTRIRDLAARQDRSAHWIMRQAIEQYVDREERRENFVQEALASWESYRETGLHLTGEEVDAWLARWGSAAESRALDCHE